MAKQLTATSVLKLKPRDERLEIPDGGCPGLFLIIQPSGHKSWALRFRRPNGKHAKLTLGPVDQTGNEADDEPVLGAPLTLAGAHLLAANFKRERARGSDVVAIKHSEKLEKKAGIGKTFAAAAIDYIEQEARRENRTWLQQARLLGLQLEKGGEKLEPISKGLADRWRDRAIAEINGDDIHAVVDEAREKGTPGLKLRRKGRSESRARVMFAALSSLFSWLVEKRRVKQNPCIGVTSPKTSKSRDRVLTDAEIIKFWTACEKEGAPFGPLLKLLLLTGCRKTEIAKTRRSELLDDGASLNLSGARTKNGKPHVVPLSPLAREILASVATEGDIVFTTNGRTFVGGWSKLKRRLDVAMQIPAWRLHDLRRTAATGMAKIGVAPHIVEAALNHISGSKSGVAGVYNQYMYEPEKKGALERWAAHVEGLVTGKPSKIIPLHAPATKNAQRRTR